MLSARSISIVPFVKQRRVISMKRHALPIDPDFLYAYTSTICNSSDPEKVRRCVECLTFPPYEDQVKIMETLRTLSKSVDVTIIQGPLMNVLAHHDVSKAHDLLTALVEYEIAASTLKELAIDAMPDICEHLQVY